jgi:hypothetical protein
LLFDVADDALAALARVVHHELRRHLDRRRVRHATLAALVDVVLRLLEVVRDVDELARPVEVLDREDAAENRFEADLAPVARAQVGLQELLVARLLDVDEIRNLLDGVGLAEIAAVSEVGLNLGCHRSHCPRDDAGPSRKNPASPRTQTR